MAGDTANPRIWLGADVFVAPVGTTAPTDLTTALNASFKALGLLSEDGMTESREQDSEDKHAYGGLLVRTVRSKHKRTIKVTALEDNLVVWGLVNPGSTAATASGVTTRTVKVPSASDPRAWVLELVDGAVKKRRAIPKGEVVEVADVTISDSEISMYELTIVVYPAADATLYKDIDNDPQSVVP